MRFYLWNHQNKGLPLVRAMQAAGWEWTSQGSKADLIFSDVDIGSRRKTLEEHHRKGKKVFIYPHSARPNLFSDFPGMEPFKNSTCQFTVSDGGIEIMRAYGFSYELRSIGWHLCEILPFRECLDPRKILFAPIHPNADGKFSHIDKQINIDTFRILEKLVKQGEIDLTVRFIRGLELNGLWRVPGVTYIEGNTDQSYAEIDAADLVIGHQTFLHIAVARGAPAVAMAERLTPRMGCNENKDFKMVMHWSAYSDLLMYPLDILAPDDWNGGPMQLFHYAAASDVDIVDWRTRLIGRPFDPQEFIKTVESYL